MLVRCAVEADLDRIAGFLVTDRVTRVTPQGFRAEITRRQYRPEWVWLAEDDGELVGQVLWWGHRHDDHPQAIDSMHVLPTVPGREAVAAELLRAGHAALRAAGMAELPAYHLHLPPSWRGDRDLVAEVDWRRAAAARSGLTDELERLRYTWTPDRGGPAMPATGDRLRFDREPDDEVFGEVLRRVAVGSLDVTTGRNVAALGAPGQVADDLAFYRGLPDADRDWWRLARTAAGDLVGFVIPSATPYARSVGYLGVLPELRGRGHIDELLGYITAFHAQAGAQAITADTDVVNVPMAAAFDRAGYRVSGIRYVLSAPPGG